MDLVISDFVPNTRGTKSFGKRFWKVLLLKCAVVCEVVVKGRSKIRTRHGCYRVT